MTGGILFLLAGPAAIGALATNIILPAFPRIGAELAISSSELGLLLSSFFVAFALGQLVVGPLADRFGRKPLALGGHRGALKETFLSAAMAHKHLPFVRARCAICRHWLSVGKRRFP